MEPLRQLKSRVKYLAAFAASTVVRDARVAALLPLLLLGCGTTQRVEQRPQAIDLSTAIASVVRVVALDIDGHRMWSGSGVMVSKTRILTARHVTSDVVATYAIRSISGAEVLARFVSAAATADWAVLEADESIGIPADIMPEGDSVEVLSSVMAVGYAAGLQDPTITFGHLQPFEGGLYRISAPIAPGNSGGGAFSLCRGRAVLIGLTVAVFAPGGNFVAHMGVVVPIGLIRDGGGLGS